MSNLPMGLALGIAMDSLPIGLALGAAMDNNETSTVKPTLSGSPMDLTNPAYHPSYAPKTAYATAHSGMLPPPLFELTVDGRSGNAELELRVAQILARAFEVFKERQRKYGSNNIARRGAKGVVVRLDDKLARLDQFTHGKGMDVKDESILDTCVDIINYTAIANICLSGKWPAYEV